MSLPWSELAVVTVQDSKESQRVLSFSVCVVFCLFFMYALILSMLSNR